MPSGFQQFKEWVFNPSAGGELGERGKSTLNRINEQVCSKYQRSTKLILHLILALRQDSRVSRGILVVILVSVGIVWLKRESSPRIIDIFVDSLETIAIASAGVVFILEIPDRQRRDHYEAWQVINSAREQSGSGGRIQALEELNKDKVSLEGLSAPGAYLFAVNLSHANLQKANLEKANLEEANLNGASLYLASLEKAILQRAILRNADFSASNLKGVNFFGSYLRGASFAGADLRGATLRYSYLRETTFVMTNLEGADLYKADLRGVRLNHSSLKNACLIDANLEGADLELCDLRGAQLQGANLSKSNLLSVSIDKAIVTNNNEVESVLDDVDSKIQPPTLSVRKTSFCRTNFDGANNIPQGLKDKLVNIFANVEEDI